MCRIMLARMLHSPFNIKQENGNSKRDTRVKYNKASFKMKIYKCCEGTLKREKEKNRSTRVGYNQDTYSFIKRISKIPQGSFQNFFMLNIFELSSHTVNIHIHKIHEEMTMMTMMSYSGIVPLKIISQKNIKWNRCSRTEISETVGKEREMLMMK